MVGNFIGILSIVFQIGVTSPAMAEGGLARDNEYKQMLDQLNRRYEGFFIHENEKQRWDRNRRSGASEAKQKRRAEKDKRERARKNFVRTPPPDMEPARRQWEANQEKLEQEREQKRKQYVKKRDEIEKVRDSARKIPANKELELDPAPAQ